MRARRRRLVSRTRRILYRRPPERRFLKTTIQALNEAFQMDSADNRPSFTPALAQPSFCSSATYAVLIKPY